MTEGNGSRRTELKDSHALFLRSFAVIPRNRDDLTAKEHECLMKSPLSISIRTIGQPS